MLEYTITNTIHLNNIIISFILEVPLNINEMAQEKELIIVKMLDAPVSYSNLISDIEAITEQCPHSKIVFVNNGRREEFS